METPLFLYYKKSQIREPEFDFFCPFLWGLSLSGKLNPQGMQDHKLSVCWLARRGQLLSVHLCVWGMCISKVLLQWSLVEDWQAQLVNDGNVAAQ